MEAFGRDMTVTTLEQDARQGDPLASRPQAGDPQAVGKIGAGDGR